MTVQGAMTVQGCQPKELTSIGIELGADDFAISWETNAQGGSPDADCFEIKLEFFDPAGRCLAPWWSKTIDHSGRPRKMLELAYPEEAKQKQVLRAFTLKVAVTAKIGHSRGRSLHRQTTRDSQSITRQLSPESFKSGRESLMAACRACSCARGAHMMEKMKVVIVGQQHMGKSSLANGIARWLHQDTGLDDQMAPAPAGHAAKTAETKCLEVPFGQFGFAFIDTPHFASVSDDNEQHFQALLSRGIPDGTRRTDFSGSANLLTDPPQAAILVVDLMQWRDQRKEVERYLRKVADHFHSAAAGKVSFPYVVAATHRDAFLSECQGERPMLELEQAVSSLRECALTEHVYTITSYKKKVVWSLEVNDQISELLCALVTFAKNQDTALQVNRERLWCIGGLGAMLAVVVALVAASGR
mmetsp:Transcript_110147/g.351000  ORF Transcript_110147/g.351000 Transcript_110147/m.351000 type:complete len:415 (-) Transcript_110147:65-1309(-)|eukprot:CAMPEP_0203871066 /NCGR_PEP_ID=MMETSP0359-20131031/18549_1 /ASSEMBLY_ACC=CAM_ASM_000338 /TAXON_ID=268821 /ORGANISM="Scrippsiella Hangoei, Strain SHTV-5" /LENGTH=414 /DNA_ID=CAMNT_0050789737 /DNA_START=26 /DNA_END=1270 /DNA_ORIENTATION=-